MFTANNRPHYLREVLRSWSRCPGIRDASMIFLCEPGCPAMVTECLTARAFCDHVRAEVNPVRFGALSAPWHALDHGFRDADYVIVAEDDTVVSPDILEYFAAADMIGRARGDVAAAFAFRHHGPEGATAEGVEITTAFESMIWATWRDRWEDIIRDGWDHDYTCKGFDWEFQRITDEKRLRCVQPQMSRCQHIGQYGGTHMRPHQHHALQSDCFARDARVTGFVLAGERDVRPARESI